jgi:hypothetical protein
MVLTVLEQLIASGAPFSSRQLAQAAGVTRQAVHKYLKQRVAEGELATSGRARAVRYTKVAPLRQRVEVASAGSVFRLSARLLLMDVRPGEVTLDFSGVSELGDEFLDEVFLVWAPAHPRVRLQVAHLPSRFAPQFFDFAKRASAATAIASAR